MAFQPARWRFTVRDYHQMARTGIFDEDDRVELIDGEVIEMTPIGPRHAGSVNRLTAHFVRAFGDVAVVAPQNPVQLGDYSEPQPDLALLQPRPDYYASRQPTPGDVLLLVEVADSSIEFDRRVKVSLYAQHGIPELWLVDLDQDAIVVYLDPTPQGYRTVRLVHRGERLAPRAFPDRELDASSILG